MCAHVRLIVATLFLVCGARAEMDEFTVEHLEGLEYPPLAAQARIEGEVSLSCILTDNGRVQKVEVLSGQPLLARTARDNASNWRFKPSTISRGTPHAFTLIYRFRLTGTCFAPTCKSDFSFDYPNMVTVMTQARHWNPAARGE